jgi:hypothetical protein
MRIDLERALTDIAATAQEVAAPVPIDRLLGRLHRRRAARSATMTVAGVGAVAAVAVGGMHLVGRGQTGPEPGPLVAADPADPADVTDPPGVTLAQPPGPVELRTFGECGAILTDPDPGTGRLVSLTVDAPSKVVAAGQPLTVTVSQSGTEWDEVEVNGDVKTVVTRDSVVVSPVGEPAIVQDSAPPVARATLETVSCANGSPLPPGEYELVARLWVTLPAGDSPVELYRAQTITVVEINQTAD